MSDYAELLIEIKYVLYYLFLINNVLINLITGFF